jgi:hypothetical protein
MLNEKVLVGARRRAGAGRDLVVLPIFQATDCCNWVLYSRGILYPSD